MAEIIASHIDEKHAVVISRQWQHPSITVDVTTEGIGVQMSLQAFVDALALEVGNPALVFSAATMTQKITAAAQRVVQGMKDVTAQVV